ncbi:MAG: hypothetical protein ACUVQ5_05550 [Candidatus Methanomethylicaceae archaeon]
MNHKRVPNIENFRVYAVNASRMAVVNTAMVGALAKVLGIISKGLLEKSKRRS